MRCWGSLPIEFFLRRDTFVGDFELGIPCPVQPTNQPTTHYLLPTYYYHYYYYYYYFYFYYYNYHY